MNINYKMLSIIIPVYNGEKYIKNCIDKVLKIDLKKEIIVVNDGSIDNSFNLLKQYGDRIILINLQKRQGVSHARNAGIKKAAGDYIAFIDVDDDFELNMHKALLYKMLVENSDISFCEFDVIKSGHRYRSKYPLNVVKISKENAITNYLTDKIFPSSCLSVYKSSVVKSILFDERLNVGEDTLFLLRCLLASTSPTFLNKVLYHYIQRSNSTLHTVNNNIIQTIDICSFIPTNESEYLKKFFQEEYEYFQLQMLYRAVNAVSLATTSKTKKQSKALIKKIYDKKRFSLIIKNKFTPKYIKIEFFVLRFLGVNFHVMIFPLYKFIRNIIRK